MTMAPNQALEGLEAKGRQLTDKNEEFIELVKKEADAKRDYAVALSQKLTKLKIDGSPITIIKELAKGDKAVADLRYEKDVAGGVLKACAKSMDGIRSQIDAYRSTLTWLRAERDG